MFASWCRRRRWPVALPATARRRPAAPQVATHLYSSPHFQAAHAPLLHALLSMLAGRCHAAAQSDLVDTLFGLAAANWSEFHLVLLPGWADRHLGGLGPSERQALLAHYGAGDLDGHSFERAALAFANDCAFLERAA